MNIGKLLVALYKIKMLSPWGLYRLFVAIRRIGINVNVLLYVAKRYGDKVALLDDDETITYRDLFTQTEYEAKAMKEKYSIKSGDKVGFICRNHISFIRGLFAVSRLGADVYLLNPDMSKSQLKQQIAEHSFPLVIYDDEFDDMMEQMEAVNHRVLCYHPDVPAINNLIVEGMHVKDQLPKSSMSKMILLTGGTTGKSKEVAHKPSLFNYLPPFLSMITRLKLVHYQSVYIATPIFHGYGLAILLLFLALGKKVVVSKRFEAERACRLIREHNVEVASVVPLMIQKMLHYNSTDLQSIACFASGGAMLPPKLVDDVFSKLGDVLYNLYGTSEAGLNMIATPQDLRYSAATIGRSISGVHVKVVDSQNKEVEAGCVGQFCMKNKWSMKNSRSTWIETGDLGYVDKNGYYFLCGRMDDMVVSGGENVYPVDLERILIGHPQIDDVAVIGVPDETFGERLRACVQLVSNCLLSEEELLAWLRPRIARYQMPREIVLMDSLPYTPVGKVDKKQLKRNLTI